MGCLTPGSYCWLLLLVGGVGWQAALLAVGGGSRMAWGGVGGCRAYLSFPVILVRWSEPKFSAS